MPIRGSCTVSMTIVLPWKMVFVALQAREWQSEAASLAARRGSRAVGCEVVRCNGYAFVFVLRKTVDAATCEVLGLVSGEGCSWQRR